MASTEELVSIWKTALGEIEVELGKSNFALFFKNSQLLSLEEGIARLGFPNKLTSDQVNSRYYALVQTALQKASKTTPLSLLFEIAPVDTKVLASDNIEDLGPLFASPVNDSNAVVEAIKRSHLRLDFSFDEFCVSTSNQLAFAAAQSVAKDPGRSYNPLFLWGGVGLGKTHLMQAIGHEILKKNPKARIVYAPGEQFTNEIIEGIRTKNTKDFKEKYRSANALLIDDIQFLSGKDTAQEEFFYTFNAIQQNEGQIVLTSDRKPSDIKDLTDRLRSRFEGGMVADISTPDSELKTAICMLKARKRGIELDNATASAIASSVDNIRSLEGALQKVMTMAQIKNSDLSEDLVRQSLDLPNQESGGASARIDSRLVLDTVCEFYNLPIKLIKGDKRDKPIAVPRQIVMYLLKKHTGMTLVEIADFLGGRDHTTIMHGSKKVESLVESDERIKQEIAQIETRLHV